MLCATECEAEEAEAVNVLRSGGCKTTNSEEPASNCRISIEVMAKGHRSPPHGLNESSATD